MEARKRKVLTLDQAPKPGEFCGESMFGGRKAELLVRLWDGRVMPIECKVSNSALNSIKRLNNDATVKAEHWRADWGPRNVVPCAVLSGVFDLRHLIEAQTRGLCLFWAHDLQPFVDFVVATGQL